jgi:hypothetical protein
MIVQKWKVVRHGLNTFSPFFLQFLHIPFTLTYNCYCYKIYYWKIKSILANYEHYKIRKCFTLDFVKYLHVLSTKKWNTKYKMYIFWRPAVMGLMLFYGRKKGERNWHGIEPVHVTEKIKLYKFSLPRRITFEFIFDHHHYYFPKYRAEQTDGHCGLYIYRPRARQR